MVVSLGRTKYDRIHHHINTDEVVTLAPEILREIAAWSGSQYMGVKILDYESIYPDFTEMRMIRCMMLLKKYHMVITNLAFS